MQDIFPNTKKDQKYRSNLEIPQSTQQPKNRSENHDQQKLYEKTQYSQEPSHNTKKTSNVVEPRTIQMINANQLN